MTEQGRVPEGRVADAVSGNWVDARAPAPLRPYLRLSRADRPIGTWLLLLPCWWGVLLSAASGDGIGWTGLWIMTGCAIGAWLMRGAGCTWNDITDRDIDAAVARTRSRPIPAGQVTVPAAIVWMCLQAIVAFFILLTFNLNAIMLGVGSLTLVCIYPFAKRFTWWPQIFLGLAFNWGALLAWTAHDGAAALPALLLYLGGIAWTLFYDTIYALQDLEDDALIGVKSTARLFGDRTPRWLARFQWSAMLLTGGAVVTAFWPVFTAQATLALAGIVAFGAHMAWQRRRLRMDDTATCLRLFRANRDAGLLVVAGFLAAALV